MTTVKERAGLDEYLGLVNRNIDKNKSDRRGRLLDIRTVAGF